ncbi:MAG: glycoside hydrolase family 57 protein [Chthoniobacterales bacterium]
MGKGYLALILHAHLPFVRHPEHEEFYEEDWLFEAITETYIPLIEMMQRLVRDGVPFKLAMSITPPLIAMLNDELLRVRYQRQLDRVIDLARREIERHREHEKLAALAQFYCDHLIATRERYNEWNKDLLGQFRDLRDAGVLEIIGSAATHGLLPLLMPTPETVRAQVLIGCDVYRETFGAEPNGFWLPECAYQPGLEKILQEANIRWFVLDAHGLALGNPRPRHAIYAPCFTPEGPAAFARDPESSREVWSAESGYPGDPAYREFYRDVGFDLPLEHLFPETQMRTPRFTGLKYHRITGRVDEKDFYNRGWAENVARTHADHFLESRRAQLKAVQHSMENPIVVMPFDAELFGHWWYEGPLFLELFLRRAAGSSEELQLTTPGEYLAANPTQEIAEPAASSWGEGGYWGMWLDPSNSWIYPHLHSAAQRMTRAARTFEQSIDEMTERVLKQLARELLLAQSSDWPFLIKTGTAKHYAAQRIHDHIQRFNKLYDQLMALSIDPEFLSDCESRDNIFPNLEWRHYV